MRLAVIGIVLALAGCHAGGSTAPRAAGDAPDGPCALIDAMLAIDDASYQKMYAGTSCGDESAGRTPRIVEVFAPAALVPPTTSCPGHAFRLFHGERDVVGMIIQLGVVANGTAWNFQASLRQPNATELPDGELESVETYCHAMHGFVEKRDGRWRTFVDAERVFGPQPVQPSR